MNFSSTGFDLSLSQGLEPNLNNGLDFDPNTIDFNDPLLLGAFDFMDGVNTDASNVSTSTMQTLFLPSVNNWNSTSDFGNAPFSSGATSVGEVHADERPVTDTSTNSVTSAPTRFLPHVDNTTPTTGNMAPSPVDELNTQSEKNTDSTAAENPPTNKDFSSISFQLTSHAQRNPLLPTQAVRTRPPKRQLDPAQARTMNEAKAAKQAMAMLVKQDVVGLVESYEENIANLAQKHSVSIEYVKRLITTASDLKGKRAPGRIQALVHIKAQEVNASLPVGSKLKAPELRKLVEQDEELLNMSDEKLWIAKRGVDEKRMLSTRGARPNVASAAKDYSATSQRMQNEFDSLHLRTGAVGFGVLAPASSDDRGRPIWFVAGNNSVDFVRKNLNTTMWDLLGNLELWASTRNSQKPATIPDLQSQCSAIIASGLRYTLNSKTVKMNYSNYQQAIVEKFHVRLIGLPNLPIFKDANGPVKPFDIKDLATLEALHAVLESGACLWARMSQDDIAEHSEWMKTQVVKERSARSDKGRKRGPRQQAADGEDENRGSSHKRRRTKDNGSTSRKRQRTMGKGSATKKKVSKQLPPQPRSREFIDSDEDSDDQSSNGGDEDGEEHADN